MSAGTAAADAVRQVLEANPIADAQRRVARRRPGVPTKQRGRAGKAQNADDFNAKHSRGGGGQFRAESESERTKREPEPKTPDQIKAVQRANGIPPTGTMDERTRLAIQNPAPRARSEVVDEERELLRDKSKDKKGGKGKAPDPKDPASIRSFQRANGLKVDGIIGPKTRAAIGKADGGSDSEPRQAKDGGSSSAPGGVLRQGAGMDKKRGNGDVKQLQTSLQELGYDLGAPGNDGKYGPITTKAIKAFQRDHGLKPDGVMGRHTRRLLNLQASRGASARSRSRAPLSADEEALSRRTSSAGRRAAQEAFLALEAADATAPSQEERTALWERFPFVKPRDGSSTGAVALKRDGQGLFVHTHRARSRSYPSVAKLPERVVRFIESTG